MIPGAGEAAKGEALNERKDSACLKTCLDTSPRIMLSAQAFVEFVGY
jgi:hypothetical protein